MTIGSVIGALVIGLILGLLGKLVAPGRQNIPLWLTILVGIVAAFIGSLIAGWLNVQETSGWFDWWELIIQIVLAAVGVSVVAGVYGRRSVH
ncbi:GlsB/YeaQ/YmgE family stress response membrane protein [Lentzea sp.]|uniref:GlsB/YeaQ/YmgE family stress response membrane protein n=1 Tax=Lentzea sp. TaxID=56099 RepID=UPI002BD4ABE0|nr:GlsB/YeaQ/YmgE family stress response membrane protein [Lentzea sp.]HUQ60876.1 GlsB/YeaQ/YmgE family stress response membrane protein [Lentzea sp.]